jgi:hypothetical protein
VRKRRFILRKKAEMWLVMTGLIVLFSGAVSFGVWFAYPHLITVKSVPRTGIPDIVFEPPADQSGGNPAP